MWHSVIMTRNGALHVKPVSEDWDEAYDEYGMHMLTFSPAELTEAKFRGVLSVEQLASFLNETLKG